MGDEASTCTFDEGVLVISIQWTHTHTHLYTVEAAGGKCLPCVVDMRNDSQVEDAVNQAVSKFGGIDILVNNASAIHLTGTVDTPMKK